MYANMRSDRFPVLLDYAAARQRESEITPIRGRSPEVKPLAERNRTWLAIRMVGDDVVIRLHSTDIITYRPNGEVVIKLGGWDSATTHETVGRILSTALFTKHKQTWIQCIDGSYPLRKDEDNVFVRGGTFVAGWRFVNPEYPMKHTLKRKVFNAISKQYDPFVTWAVAATKLRGGCTYNHEEFENEMGKFTYWHEVRADANRVSELMLDPNSWYKALLLTYFKAGRYRVYDDVDPVAIVRNVITNVIKRKHRDEVFDFTEVRDGSVVKDVNAEFFAD